MLMRNETVCFGCQSGLAQMLFPAKWEQASPAVPYDRPIRRGQCVAFLSQGDELAGKLFLPRVRGRVPVVIICHGAGEWKENYYEMCEHLAQRGIGSLAMDMHGHGESGGERFCVDMRRWAADVHASIDYLLTHPKVDGRRIGAFGLDSGGTAILEAALTDPRLKALILLGPTVRTSLSRPLRLIVRALLELGRIKLKLTNKTLRLPLLKLASLRMASDSEINRRIVSNPFSFEAFRAFPLPGAEQAFFVDTIRRVARITVPTLVLWGEDDQVNPPQTGRRLFQAMTCKKQLRTIPGNGHLGHLDRNRSRVFALTAEWILQNVGTEPVTAYAAPLS